MSFVIILVKNNDINIVKLGFLENLINYILKMNEVFWNKVINLEENKVNIVIGLNGVDLKLVEINKVDNLNLINLKLDLFDNCIKKIID